MPSQLLRRGGQEQGRGERGCAAGPGAERAVGALGGLGLGLQLPGGGRCGGARVCRRRGTGRGAARRCSPLDGVGHARPAPDQRADVHALLLVEEGLELGQLLVPAASEEAGRRRRGPENRRAAEPRVPPGRAAPRARPAARRGGLLQGRWAGRRRPGAAGSARRRCLTSPPRSAWGAAPSWSHTCGRAAGRVRSGGDRPRRGGRARRAAAHQW